MFIQRLKSGTGAHTRPNQGEIGIVNVKTMLPDGTVIDERKNYRFTVGQLEAVQGRYSVLCGNGFGSQPGLARCLGQIYGDGEHCPEMYLTKHTYPAAHDKTEKRFK